MSNGEPGRPSIYSDELAARICGELAEGRSLRSVCREEWAPSCATVFNWLGDPSRSTFLAQYTRAVESRADAHAEDIIEISDTPIAAKIEKLEPMPVWDAEGKAMLDENGRQRVELRVTESRIEDALGHRRLMVDTRKWLMARMKPKRYGEKLELAGDKDRPLSVSVLRFTDPEAPKDSDDAAKG